MTTHVVTDLFLFSVVPLLSLFVSAGYAAVATYDLRDWRPVLFTLLLVLMSVHQINEVGIYLETGVATASRGFGEYPETVVNVLAGVAVVSVLRLVHRQRRLTDELETRLDEVRELQRENDRLEEFASVVSHDLRNPLNTARGYVDLAREEENIDRLDAVERALDRMGTIIEDTLTLAQRGRAVEVTDEISVPELADDCWAVVETDSATLETEDFTISGDHDRLRHIFENLFRNAIQHGDGAVTVRVGELDGGGFYVADDGPGIPAAEREDVFALGHTTASDGTGFGLAIVERVADAHGLSVSVTESADGGARFEFRPTDDTAQSHAGEDTTIEVV